MFTTGESDRFQLDENNESQNKMETLKALFHLLRDIRLSDRVKGGQRVFTFFEEVSAWDLTTLPNNFSVERGLKVYTSPCFMADFNISII